MGMSFLNGLRVPNDMFQTGTLSHSPDLRLSLSPVYNGKFLGLTHHRCGILRILVVFHYHVVKMTPMRVDVVWMQCGDNG